MKEPIQPGPGLAASDTADHNNASSTSVGITRRDLIHGVALAGLGSLLPSKALADAVERATAGTTATYPPSLTGLRGNHDGSWETAHQLARHGQTSFGPVTTPEEGVYDLIVVGAGVSGLSAAYFYRQQKPDARILILDNHDDFGGHAKRNEFTIGDKTLLGYGGSQTMQEPSGYPKVVKAMLKDLGVSFDDFYDAYDDGFFKRHGLTAGILFNEKDWGQSRLVKYDMNNFGDFMPMADTGVSTPDAVAEMPLSDGARAQLLRLLTEEQDQIPHIPRYSKESYLYSISYRTFLERDLGITEPELIRLFQNSTYEMGVGFDSVSAGTAILFYALPGRGATGIPKEDDPYFEPYIHHFPDGNASVARLLVQRLMPHMSDASGMYEMLGERLDYGQLDSPDADVRLRLSSTVVNVGHVGPAASANEVDVTYVRDGKAERARSSHVILACYHAVIPAMCPELPAAQRAAMSSQVKVPVLYTNVALNNWHAWKEMGIAAFIDPTGYHINAMLDFPVSFGDYHYASSPDEPIIAHMEKFPYGAAPGMAMRDRLRAGRHELLSTPYADIEKHIRGQLQEALGPGGFKADRDIAGITVNRWAHGYSYFYDELEEDWEPGSNDPEAPHVIARQRHGRIAIANSDADARAMLEAAIGTGYRAVTELV